MRIDTAIKKGKKQIDGFDGQQPCWMKYSIAELAWIGAKTEFAPHVIRDLENDWILQEIIEINKSKIIEHCYNPGFDAHDYNILDKKEFY